MKPEQWSAIVDRVGEDLVAKLNDHEESILGALEKNAWRISIGLQVEIVSEGAHSADVKTSISYVVDRVKDGSKRRVVFDQEPLPGMPDATSSGKKKAIRR